MSLAMGIAAPEATTAPGIAGEPVTSPLALSWATPPEGGGTAAPAFDAATVPPAVATRSRTGAGRVESAVVRHVVRHRPAASRAARRAPVPADPRSVARRLVAGYGWSSTQFHCLDLLWTRESNWQVHEANPTSGAYGIPQALPADKLARFGADWRDSALTQIRWGLWYIAGRYGTPCAAWAHSEAYDYY